jgi:ankyrin repeat protein
MFQIDGRVLMLCMCAALMAWGCGGDKPARGDPGASQQTAVAVQATPDHSRPKARPEIPDHVRPLVEAFGKCSRLELDEAVENAREDASLDLVRALLQWHNWLGHYYIPEEPPHRSVKQGEEYLQETGTDADLSVVMIKIRETLAGIRNPETVPVYIEMLEPEHGRLHGIAAKVLADLGDKRAVEPLRECLKVGNAYEVQVAIRKLTKVEIEAQRKLNVALVEAIKTGNLGKAREAIEQGANVNRHPDSSMTPLYLAVQNAVFTGRSEIVALLLEKGASAKAPQENRPLLLMPAERGRVEIAKMLLDKGADPEVTDARGRTPLWHAINRKNEEMRQLLLSHGAKHDLSTYGGQKGLLQTIRSGDVYAVRSLLESGVDANTRLERGDPLLFGCLGNLEMVELLVSKGADVDAKNQEGLSALHVIVKESYPAENLQFALDQGADVNVRDRQGRVPLHYARSGHLAALLVENGGRINALDNEKKTPYDIRKEKVLRLLGGLPGPPKPEHAKLLSTRDKNRICQKASEFLDTKIKQDYEKMWAMSAGSHIPGTRNSKSDFVKRRQNLSRYRQIVAFHPESAYVMGGVGKEASGNMQGRVAVYYVARVRVSFRHEGSKVVFLDPSEARYGDCPYYKVFLMLHDGDWYPTSATSEPDEPIGPLLYNGDLGDGKARYSVPMPTPPPRSSAPLAEFHQDDREIARKLARKRRDDSGVSLDARMVNTTDVVTFGKTSPTFKILAKPNVERMGREWETGERETKKPVESPSENLKTHGFRTWTDNTGQHTIEAKFSSYAVGQVTLEKKDGSKVTLTIERLSPADHEWLDALRK